MPNPESDQAVRRWLEYADGDLRSAEAQIERDDLPPRVACFLAQQAAEKALKAGLVFLGIDFPHRHDLEELAAMLPEGWKVKECTADLAWLSQWAVEARYPGELPGASVEDGSRAVGMAQDVLRIIRGDLGTSGFHVERV